MIAKGVKMEQEKNKNRVIALLVIIIVILAVLCTLFATETISLRSNTSNNNQQASEGNQQDNDVNITKEFTENDFKKVIDDELYILFGFKSLDELTNRRKLTLVFNKLDSDYATVDSTSKERVEEVFKTTSISNLGINHETFDVFTYDNGTYTKNKEQMSKRNLFNCGFANKVESFEKKDNKYIISVKYLFTDSCPVSGYYYGTYNSADQNESNKIVEAYQNSKVNYNNTYLEPQKYLDENYDSIKDKLDTYVYTFEVSNDKINLVDFSVK